MKLDSFTRAYITAALWSSTDNSDDSGGEPLDSNYSIDDIAPATLAEMQADCASFQTRNAQDLESVRDLCDDSRAGHNFWLNRNGHGTGFWDEYFGPGKALRDAFTRLSDDSETCGSYDLCIGDDGQIHGQ